MRIVFLFLACLLSANAGAQRIRGIVTGPEDQVLEFASVRLFSVVDSSVVVGAYTDAAGAFELNGFPKGRYYLKITLANFEPLIRDFDFSPGKSNDEIIRFKMKADATVNLDEMTAAGSLDVLKTGIDKKVYNVEDDIAVKGGSVNDVLNNIPSIDVDQDGNVSLRGDANVTILIDGRPSTLTGTDGQSLLDAIPANSIERIEVVTNPSAKYDPDGTSGIINIVLKRNKLRGFNGLVSATAGTGNLYEANLGMSYRNQRFNFYFNYSLNYYEGYRNYYSQLSREVTPDSTTVLKQDREGTDLKSTHSMVLGTDFYFSERTVLGFSATGSLNTRVRTGDLQNRLYAEEDVLNNRWDRISRDPRYGQNFDANLNVTHKFKNDRGEISMNANQGFSDERIAGYYQQYWYDAFEVPTGQSPLVQQLSNNSKNEITTAQIDYSYLFPKIKGRIEAGTKAIVSSESTDTDSKTLDSLTQLFVGDTLSNFTYRYEEQIYSVYALFGQELGKFKYQAGLRGEYAEQIPYLTSLGLKYTNAYFNLFPSAHVRYQPRKGNEFSLSYSRRINRASAHQLNPFTSYADPLNLRSGNPQLRPEYIDSYDLGYALNKKKFNFSFSVFHRRTKDVINRIRRYYDNNTAVTTFDNVDQSVSTGFESVIVYKPWSWFKSTLSLNAFYIDYTSSQQLAWNNDGFNWSVKYILSSDFWKKTMTVQLNLSYNAPRVTPQGIVQPRTGIDISVEKRLFANRFSVGARVSDIFNTKGFRFELTQEGVNQKSEYKWLTRRFYLTLSYKIGKYEKKKGSHDSDGGDF